MDKDFCDKNRAITVTKIMYIPCILINFYEANNPLIHSESCLGQAVLERTRDGAKRPDTHNIRKVYSQRVV